MSLNFRIFKENSLNPDERFVATLGEAAIIYSRYFADGYSVCLVEVESGVEYAMHDEKLVPLPYRRAHHG